MTNILDVINAILEVEGKTQVWLSDEMGYSVVTGLRNRLYNGNMGVELLIEMLEKMGWRLVAQKNNKQVVIRREK